MSRQNTFLCRQSDFSSFHMPRTLARDQYIFASSSDSFHPDSSRLVSSGHLQPTLPISFCTRQSPWAPVLALPLIRLNISVAIRAVGPALALALIVASTATVVLSVVIVVVRVVSPVQKCKTKDYLGDMASEDISSILWLIPGVIA